MTEKLLKFITTKRYKLFSRTVSLYIYVIYIRAIYLAGNDISERINADYQSFFLHKIRWVLNNQEVLIDIAIIIFFSLIIGVSLYLIHKKVAIFMLFFYFQSIS